jgi:hypothetical protein
MKGLRFPPGRLGRFLSPPCKVADNAGDEKDHNAGRHICESPVLRITCHVGAEGWYPLAHITESIIVEMTPVGIALIETGIPFKRCLGPACPGTCVAEPA